MKTSKQYTADILRYFHGKPEEYALYSALYPQLACAFPTASVRVQKTQISFYGTHLFAAVSLPFRRKKEWPKNCLLVTFGLPFRLDSPRIALAVEPYPQRWTHHVLLSHPTQIDGVLLDWLRDAYAFSEGKRGPARHTKKEANHADSH